MAPSDRATDVLDYDEYIRLIQQVDELVAAFDGHPDEATRERVLTLLTAVDLLHRTALGRLVDGLRAAGAAEALERVRGDRVVETLLALYDLAELDVPDELPDGTAPGPGAADSSGATVGFVPRESLTVRPTRGREG